MWQIIIPFHYISETSLWPYVETGWLHHSVTPTHIVLVIDLCLQTDQKQSVTKDNKLVGNSQKYRFLSLSIWNRSEINLFERGKYKKQFYAVGTSKYWLHKTLITSWFLYKNHQPYCPKSKLDHGQLKKLLTAFMDLNLKCYCTR